MTANSKIDVLIRGARVVDGTGNPWFPADVGLAGDRIEVIAPPGSIDAGAAGEVVDAVGMVVSPGFIDIQSHSLIPLMMDGRCLSKITQGVTTEIMGEAWTPAPHGGRTSEYELFGWDESPKLQPWAVKAQTWSRFRNWLDAMIEHGVSPNIGSYLGGGSLRAYAKGLDIGAADEGELETMRRVVRESMEDGAFGVSFALIYPPDAFVGTDELVAVCTVVGEYGGTYITHLRSEADEFLEALEEALDIGRRAGVGVEVYHLKASGRANWHKMEVAIARINRARAEGQDVTADMYPYIAGGTGLSSVFPPDLAAEGKFLDNLRDPETRAKAHDTALHPTGGWEALGALAGPDGIYPLDLRLPEHQDYIGKSIAQIAAIRGQEWIDTVTDLLLAEEHRIGTVYFMMSEDNVARQLKEPWIKVSTDAGGLDPEWAKTLGSTHPRSYGTYPRVLGKYVREEGVITLEDAVRKMTSSVARRLSITERGLLQPGCYADVVIFDPDTIIDNATFEQPHQLSTGVRDVWVNGSRVVRDGEHTGATPGRIVDGPGRKS